MYHNQPQGWTCITKPSITMSSDTLLALARGRDQALSPDDDQNIHISWGTTEGCKHGKTFQEDKTMR